jgi:putative ATP-binding cassette transporter
LSRLASTLGVIWRLASPYFNSEDRLAGRLLLAGVIAIELSLTSINVMLNHWQNRFYNALQDRNWDSFVTEL